MHIAQNRGDKRKVLLVIVCGLEAYNNRLPVRNLKVGYKRTDFLTEVPGSENQKAWKIYVDVSATKSGSGVGVLLQSPQGDSLQLAIKLQFRVSNNEAEYEALIAGLQPPSMSECIEWSSIRIRNSRHASWKRYVIAFDKLKAEFQEVTIVNVPRADNSKADELAKLASTVHTWTIEEPAIQEQLVAHIDHASPPSLRADWRDSFIIFLRKGVVPDEAGPPHTFKQRASRFTLVGDILYKRAFSPS
ncbi:uncharacterized protein LOC141845973 [Curcuma longa]|uniref:uncharacterized protein LOC141845973 n=1 Tax=Curcuma longa TaxID=136217 RepID=UPI003D9F3362